MGQLRKWVVAAVVLVTSVGVAATPSATPISGAPSSSPAAEATSRQQRTLYLPLVDNVTYNIAVQTGFLLLMVTLAVSMWYYRDRYDSYLDYGHDYDSEYYDKNGRPLNTLPVLWRLTQAIHRYQDKYNTAGTPH